MKILNGMSIGIVVSLIPSAMLGQIATTLNWGEINIFLNVCTSLMCFLMGICIAIQYKLDPISSCSLAMATMLAGGSIHGINEEGFFQLKGAGDVINATIGAIIAVILIKYLAHRLGAYKLLVIPVLVVVVVGLITSFTAEPIAQITTFIGLLIEKFTTLQPYLMSMLIALSFALIIISPISTVAVALLINLSGNGSAAANIGIAAAALTLAILSYKTNGLGTALAHFIGSPKIQMANFIKSPKMIIPSLISALICSIVVPIFNLQGTPMSAGFGISGLIGPLGNLGINGFTTINIVITLLTFIIIPTIVSYIISFICKDRLKLVDSEDYRLNI
ncbi:PTS sugar transporter subunit IIC [Erysipelotrichaceae bacterium OttesenSCG-928-M19]|nr:PTS sugar transporter subunit IIC [Erysipelotrichaceae bacterium OttesenSCG-928-M19]